jgi:hypothetical protein
MENKLCLICFFGLLLVFGNAVKTNAETYCVSSSDDLKNTLITAANNGEDDTIRLEQGYYSGNFVYASTEAHTLSIEGGYTNDCATRVLNAANTILDGLNADTVLVLSTDKEADFTISGLTLQNGQAQTITPSGGTVGGGLYLKTEGNLTLTDSIVRGCSADSGGGMCVNAKGMATISNCIISNDSAVYGGGAFLYRSDSINLSNNIIINNSAINEGSGAGGGIYVSSTNTCTLTNNTICRNRANVDGGGGFDLHDNVGAGGIIVDSTNNVILRNNNISNNTATCGGGGVAIGASQSLMLANNVISNNVAVKKYFNSGGGGAYLYCQTGTTTIINNTITGNSAEGDCGGLKLGLFDETAIANISNNIIWNNSAPSSADVSINNDGDGDHLPSSVNFFNNDFNQSADGFNSVLSIVLGTSNFDNYNPIFFDPGNGAYYLKVESSLINAGTNSASNLPATDKDSNPRIINGVVDLGAYEYPGSMAAIAVVPAFLSFDDVKTGASETRDIHIYNIGGSSLSIGNSILYNTISGKFLIGNDNCSGRALEPGAGCILEVQYTPTDDTYGNSSLKITSSDANKSPITVGIQGRGVSTTDGESDSGGGGGGGGCFINSAIR